MSYSKESQLKRTKKRAQKKKGRASAIKKNKRKLLIPLPKLDTFLWDVVSLAFRIQDANDEGICKCATCPSEIYYYGTKQMHMGHFRSRRFKNTKFLRTNNASQCATCNSPAYGGKPYEMGTFLNKKYGEGTAEEMIRLAKIPTKWDRQDYKKCLIEMVQLLNAVSIEKNLMEWKDGLLKWQLKAFNDIIDNELTVEDEIILNNYRL